jgi:hypothetical protein
MPRKLIWILAVASLTAVGLSAAVAATPATKPAAKNFVAKQPGVNETPAVDSKGVGTAVLTLRNGVLTYRLSASNLQDVTAAHIHCGAKGVAGPVVAVLYSGATIDPHGLFAKGTATVVPVGDSAECPGGVADLNALLAKMRTGGTYVNVHTVANPAGEIRGQVRKNGPRPA